MPFLYSAVMWFLMAPARSFAWNVTLTTIYATISFVAAAAFVGGVIALLNSHYVPVPQQVLDIWYWTMPDNVLDCIMAVFTCTFMRAIYDIRIKLIEKYVDTVKIS